MQCIQDYHFQAIGCKVDGPIAARQSFCLAVVGQSYGLINLPICKLVFSL